MTYTTLVTDTFKNLKTSQAQIPNSKYYFLYFNATAAGSRTSCDEVNITLNYTEVYNSTLLKIATGGKKLIIIIGYDNKNNGYATIVEKLTKIEFHIAESKTLP